MTVVCLVSICDSLFASFEHVHIVLVAPSCFPSHWLSFDWVTKLTLSASTEFDLNLLVHVLVQIKNVLLLWARCLGIVVVR